MSEQLAPNGRQISVWHQKDNKLLKFTSSAKTYAELQKVIGLEVSIDWSQTKAILRDNKHVLEQPDAELPAGDFAMFLFPQKVKSGMAYEGMSYNQLRSEASKRGLLKGVASVDTKGLLKLLEADDKKQAKVAAKATPVAKVAPTPVKAAAKPEAKPAAKAAPASSAPQTDLDKLYHRLVAEMKQMIQIEVAKQIPGAKGKMPSDDEIIAEARALKARI